MSATAPDRLGPLASPAFLGAIALLVANDLVLKVQFHNWVTGKLSDCAGLFALAFFCSVLWPRRRGLLALAIALLFVWWKSPASQSAIDALNGVLPLPFVRTVDYADLVALPAIWLGSWSSVYGRPWPIGRWATMCLGVLSPVAFVATSMPGSPPVRMAELGPRIVDRADVDAEVEQVVDDVTKEFDLHCRDCGRLRDGRDYTYAGGMLAFVASFDTTDRTLYYNVLYPYKKRDKLASLDSALAAALEKAFPGVAIRDAASWGKNAAFTIRTALTVDVSGKGRSGPVTVRSVVEATATAHGLAPDKRDPSYFVAGKVLGPRPGNREMYVAVVESYGSVDVACWADSCRAEHDALVADLEARFAEAFGPGAVAHR